MYTWFGCGGAPTDEIPCPEGHYCLTPSEIQECPNGYFCSGGTSMPKPCIEPSQCTQGTVYQTSPMLIIYTIMPVLLSIMIILCYKNGKRSWKELKRTICPIFYKAAVCRSIIFNDIIDHSYSTATIQQTNTDSQTHTQKTLKTDEVVRDPLRITSPDPVTRTTRRASHASKVVQMNNLLRKTDFRMELSFSNLSVKLKKNSQVIINSLSATFYPGTITAIMGPSGAGKTTLINALCDVTTETYATMEGIITVNGEQCETLQSFSDVIGYVPQFSSFHKYERVSELLKFNADFRRSKSLSIKDKQDLVTGLLHLLDLNHVRDSIIGDSNRKGISGGEMQRVNIGMELVANPSLLLLDGMLFACVF